MQHVREVTVKSISMAMGVRRPGFQLLSLASGLVDGELPEGEKTYADTPCFLPDQLEIYTHRYLPLFVISLLVLAVSNYREFGPGSGSGSGSRARLAMGRGRPSSLILPSTRYESSPWTLANPFDKHRSRSPSPVSLSGARTPRPSSTPYANGNGFATFGEDTTPNGYTIPPAYRASPIPSPAGLLSADTPAMIHAFDRDEEDVGGESERERYDTIAPRAGYAHAYPFPARRIAATEDDLEDGPGIDEYLFLTSGRHRRRSRRDMFGHWPHWSWTFVLGGRRRRMSVGVPRALQSILSPSGSDSGGGARRKSLRGRSPFGTFIEDLVAVAISPVVLFVMICVIMFW